MKPKINSLLVEGIVFCGGGLWLLSYSLTSQANAFNKKWSQSPYLFPLIVAVFTIILSLMLIAKGAKKTKEGISEPAHFEGAKIKHVIAALAFCCLYYVALKFLEMPDISFNLQIFTLTISTFEIVTLIFLIVMMLYMGVRKLPVLIFVPLGMTLFLSIAFRSLLHVLLP